MGQLVVFIYRLAQQIETGRESFNCFDRVLLLLSHKCRCLYTLSKTDKRQLEHRVRDSVQCITCEWIVCYGFSRFVGHR